MRKVPFLFVVFACSAIFTFAQNVTQGSLYASGKSGNLGECPLKNTSVKADISGFLARVTVTQEFENSFTEPIEAVYTFPLSQNSAVDDMTMKIGERIIRGKIMKREEARKVYEQAKTEGKTASLLDQQRPNIFTQAVANIMPNEKIFIEISYVETLKYEDGQYEFVFPMTVGPRYIPSSVSPTDAQNISPKIAETRAGHDISLDINLDAGVPVESVFSTSHPIAMTNLSSNSSKISLREERTIPNKDFVLRYDVTGKRIEDALLTHRAEKGGFFSLILSPPGDFKTKDITPKEIVFVLDTSGSMSGFPIEKAKEAMKLSLEGLNPQDTFNLITFAGDTSILFDKPVPATPENLAMAKQFLESRRGSGGTEMMKAIRAALEPTESQKHLRVVCFMTDGYVGNEAEIIAEIQKHPKARVFSFGIGNSVNRFLLDKMAQEGSGEVEYVGLQDDGSRAARKFYERVRTPLLTDISIDWNGLPVEDVYPSKIGDLFSAKPVILNGRYTKGAKGSIRLKGYVAGKLLVRDIPVNLPDNEPDHDVLATLWARKRIDGLMSDFYRSMRDEKARGELQTQITSLGIEFRLLTQFTSFVAVEDRVVNQNGTPTRVEVPVEIPSGMSSQTVMRESDAPFRQLEIISSLQRPPTVSYSGGGTGSGKGQGNGSGNGTGDASTLREEKRAFSALRVDGASGSTDSFVIDGAEINQNPVKKDSGSGVLALILRRVEGHQKALKSLRAEVLMQKYDSALKQSDTLKGSLLYLSGENSAVRIDWQKPEEVFSLVKDSFVIYRPRTNTAISAKASVQMKTAFEFFRSFSSANMTKNFNMKYIGEEKLNDTTAVWHLELTPKAATNYKMIELWIDGNGMIVQVKISENNDDWTNISLLNLKKNAAIDLKEFEIAMPNETKIIKN